MKIFDPIYGFIDIDSLIEKILKTIPFQRLKSIHQIAAASFVYGGGTHTRAEHSMGTMHMASKIFDRIIEKESIFTFFPELNAEKIRYWRSVLQAASLLHDVGHLPFSHLAEEELLGTYGHEDWTRKIIESSFLQPIWESEGLCVHDIVKIALGKQCCKDPYTPWETIVTQMLTGDFGGDRIDYLLRDSHYTGLSYGHIDYQQLIHSLRLLPYQDKIVLGLEEDGLESCYGLFLARYFMHKRLYQNSNVKAYSFHMKEMVKRYILDSKALDSVENYLRTSDFEILAKAYLAIFDPTDPNHSHAMAIFEQKDRIKVYPVNNEGFDILKKRFDNEKDKVFLEKGFCAKKGFSLSFPILMKNDIVAEAGEIAEVFIPDIERSWVYASHEMASEVSKIVSNDSKFSHKSSI
ncbi:MAG: HD domain-containing protein [Verrucomicrobia bacterium]|nr:HD domain-containing protein [Verrucomicrobiota bacterium]